VARHKGTSLVVHATDVRLELVALDAPLSAAPNLDGLEFSAPDQRIRLRRRDVEDLCDVGEGEETLRCHHPDRAFDRGGSESHAARRCTAATSSTVSSLTSRWSKIVGQHPRVVIAPPSPSPRRIAVPRWIDARLVSGLLMVVFAVAMGAHIVGRAQARSAVLAFTRDLGAGTTIQSGDVEFVRVALSKGQRTLYVEHSAATVGKKLDRRVTRGELVARSDLEVRSTGTTVVIPLPGGAAPSLHRGQHIVVWSTAGTCGVIELVHDVTVQAVDRDDRLAASDGQRVIVDVPDEAAVTIVKALSDENAVLRAGVVSRAGQAPTSPSSSCPDADR